MRRYVFAVSVLLAACSQKPSDQLPDNRTARPTAAVKAAYDTATMASAPHWSYTVTKLPNGALLVGNPDAKHQIVIGLGPTSPGSKKFVDASLDALLRGPVNAGSYNLSFHPFARNPVDLAEIQLVECVGGREGLSLLRGEFQRQPAIIESLQTASNSRFQGSANGTQRVAAISEFLGLPALAIAHGASAACMTEEAGMNRIVELMDRDVQHGEIAAVPYFFLDGVQVAEGRLLRDLSVPARENAPMELPKPPDPRMARATRAYERCSDNFVLFAADTRMSELDVGRAIDRCMDENGVSESDRTAWAASHDSDGAMAEFKHKVEEAREARTPH